MTSPSAASQQAATRAYRTAAMLLGIGALHFIAPKPFDGIVPAELPGSARTYTYASGVAEIGIGGMLLAPRTRRLGALAAVALYVSVFPANVNMVRLWFQDPTKPLPMRLVAIARLPFQIPMVTQALKIYRQS
ncbi:DoxX family protein [Mycobacterium sp. SMC-4]|uniref:DoxX family protein n=1 Tax=Mycobacterium sp. SMC-4 TaxID=2857059 RepID=UPI003D053167